MPKESFKIYIYSDFEFVYGYQNIALKTGFEKLGIPTQIIYPSLVNGFSYQNAEAGDINLYMLSGGMMNNLIEYGLASKGKHIGWLFMPVNFLNPDRVTQTLNDMLEKIVAKFDVLLCMNEMFALQCGYKFSETPIHTLHACYPFEIKKDNWSYSKSEKKLAFIATPTKRRNELIGRFALKDIDLRYHANLYKEDLEEVWSTSVMSLQVSKTNYIYFDQFRTFLAIANNCIVLSEPCPDYAEYGFVPGVHFLQGVWDDLPDIYLSHKDNPDKLREIAFNALCLVEERFGVDVTVEKFFNILNSEK